MGVNIVINPSHPEILALAQTLATEGVPQDARLIYRARNSVYALSLPDGTAVNIKAFRPPSAPNAYIYRHLRKSKAERSYINSMHLIRLGFGSPEPLAYIEISHCGRLRESYYLSRQIEDADDLRWWERKADAEPLLRALAEEIKKMHRAGVLHKDFSPGNILYRRTAAGYSFYLIDVNRMRFGVHSRQAQLGMFAVVNIDSEEETRRLARYYGECAGIDPEMCAEHAAKLLRSYIHRKHRNKTLKKLLPKHK